MISSSNGDTNGAHGEVETWALDELTPTRRDAPNDVAGGPQNGADALVDDAFEQGRALGRSEGEAATLQALRTSIDALNDAVGQVTDHSARWLGIVQENVAALAVAIARSITDREVATDAAVVAELVRKAIAEFPPDVELTVRLNPDDCSAVLALGASWPQNGAHARKQIQLLADRNILKGGCMVDGPDRIVDGRVDTALERVYRRLISADV